MPKLQTIRVYPNPYIHLDHEGRPAGAMLRDPIDDLPYSSDKQVRQHVGAVHKAVKIGQSPADATIRSNRDEEVDTHDHFFDFDHPIEMTAPPPVSPQGMQDLLDAAHAKGPRLIELPYTPFYHRAVNSGELLAADAKTAKLCGFRPQAFRDPFEVLAEEQAGAIARWKMAHEEEPEATVKHWAEFHTAKTTERAAAKAARAAAAAKASNPTTTTPTTSSAPTTTAAPGADKGGK